MRGSWRFGVALGCAVALLAGSGSVVALVDDFEDDDWLPFTHFHLGDRAVAGYSSNFARSGTRSFHVGIWGWTIRDFGAAYGYALYPTRRTAVSELRVSLLYEALQDLAASPWDAYAAGVRIDLLDASFRNVGQVRYVTAYQASRNAGRCAPTVSDLVLPMPTALGTWTDVRRNPTADFPFAPWQAAEFVKVSVGFLCAAGLTGASYSLYFDDFSLDTGVRDTDGDGLGDLEEEGRVYTARVTAGSGPSRLPVQGATTIEIEATPAAGSFAGTAVDLEIAHPDPDDLSVELMIPRADGVRSQILWDPGFHARGAAILAPSHGSAVHGSVSVRAMAWRPNPLAQLLVDGIWVAGGVGDSRGAFELSWNSDEWAEGSHRLFVIAQALEGGELVTRTSPEIIVSVDRTAPDLTLLRPRPGDTLSGLAVIESDAYDGQGLAAVELWIDGSVVDVRTEEPFTFVYDTLDLANGEHAFEVRARDRSRNEAVRSMTAIVSNKDTAPPPPCSPVCNFGSGTTVGDLPAISFDPRGRVIPLPSGGLLEVSESFRVPWRAGVVRSETGVHLVLDVTRSRTVPERDGLVGTEISASDVIGIRSWRVIVRNYGGEVGLVRGVSILLGFRTSPALADTDHDGLVDSVERSSTGTVPVLPDSDSDLLMDGEDHAPRTVRFLIDGIAIDRIVHTDPLDYDSDDDGLLDGPELYPSEGANPTDPMDRDTDRDGLWDGAERLTYHSDPTLTDTDGDTLTDSMEVTPREFRAEIDGVEVVRPVVTSPTLADTDDDGLRDDEEWDGVSGYGFLTDPSDPDTDRDGLSDLDEVKGLNRKPTNPLRSDTDADGVIDGLDLSPTELWNLPWRSAFEPGLIRFSQRFHALGVRGVSATIWTYRIDDGSCVYLSDHTVDATRSSDESFETVLATINHVLVEGGESNFTATTVEDLGQQGFGTATIRYGACDFWEPRQYRFEYIHDDRAFDINFMNSAEVAIRDDSGDLFYHATLDIPIQLSKPQEVVLQFSITPGEDVGGETVVPALVYSLVRGSDFLTTAPFYRNVAIGASLDDQAYEFHLRISKDIAMEENVVIANGVPMATLFVMPVWLTSGASGVTRSGLNATHLKVASAISLVQEAAELVVARRATDMEALEAALPASATGLATGHYTFESYSVYLYRLGDSFDSGAPEASDAIYLVGESPEEIATFQQAIAWAPDEAWVRRSEASFGVFLGVFKIIRRGISLTSQVTARMFFPLVSVPPGTSEQMSFGRSAFVVSKLTNIETGQPYYVVGSTAVQTVKVRVVHPEMPGVTLTEVRTIERELRGEIVDDLDDSRLLTGVKYSQLRSALRGAAIGATLVIFGSQAVLAFRDGDTVKGSVYAAAGATAIFGIVKADVPLLERVFTRVRISKGISIKLGTAAAVAVGGLLASYEVYLAGQSNNPVARLSHYEGAGAIVVDTLVASVPLYGTAAMLGWQLGLLAAVGLQAIIGTLPDPIALKIVGTPGSAVAFVFEYVFATEIPSDVAEDALVQLLKFLASVATFSNSLDPPRPTILLVP